MTTIDLSAANAAFKALHPAEQRVAICVDAIKQLDRKKIEARSGVYFSLYTRSELSTETDLQRLLHQDAGDVSCRACAMGALFASAVRVADDYTLRLNTFGARGDGLNYVYLDTSDDSGFSNHLQRYFDWDQLELMEGAFEHFGSYDHRNVACEFGDRFPDSESRLRGILLNVIDHGGTFVPEDVTRCLLPELDDTTKAA